MPELPEVEVVRRDLDGVLTGRTLRRVEVHRDRAVRREPDAAAFVDALTGRLVASTSRVGKFLVVDLGDGDTLVVHLGMSGQLRVAAAGDERARHTHVVLALDDGHEVRFVDPRTFGQMFRSGIDSDSGRPQALAHLGPDALVELDRPAALGRILAGRRTTVKARLMDQCALAGLGNIYSDEVLWRAGVRGDREAGSLSEAETARVFTACAEVLPAAIAARGSSLADAQYVDLQGSTGEYQHQHGVHARAGQQCPVCAAVIVRGRMAGRSAYWCPGCQS